MWSGPRNLSTAMMYSFGNRADFSAMDEPFYAPYLKRTGIAHPMREDILTGHEADPDKVALMCMNSGKPHTYMKHMPHHMLDGFPINWANGCTNIHLLRHPARVIASYAAKRAHITLDDIGFAQQMSIYETLGGLVIDSADIRQDPDGALQTLCSEIGLTFDPAMLSWHAGPRQFDGIWAAHWYGSVHRSTGFAGAEGPLPDLPGYLLPLLKVALPIYEELADRAVRLVAH